jgi:hypothetical protein
MTGSPWLVAGLVLIVIVVVGWPVVVLLSSRGRQHGGRGSGPRDRWLTGGMFRGDPRAVNRRDEVPGPEELPDPGELGPDDTLPPEPAETARRRWQATDSGEAADE